MRFIKNRYSGSRKWLAHGAGPDFLRQIMGNIHECFGHAITFEERNSSHLLPALDDFRVDSFASRDRNAQLRKIEARQVLIEHVPEFCGHSTKYRDTIALNQFQPLAGIKTSVVK